MKKAFYSLTNLTRGSEKITGIGYVADNQLITAQYSSKKQKPYLKVWDCIKYCKNYNEEEQIYSGFYTEYVEYQDKTIEIDYKVWIKVIDDKEV